MWRTRMAVHKKLKLEDIKNWRSSLKIQTKNKDLEKIRFLYFERGLWIEEIEQHFNGKYTYNELKSIIKNTYKEYYDKENANGR